MLQVHTCALPCQPLDRGQLVAGLGQLVGDLGVPQHVVVVVVQQVVGQVA
jgi:hypothetical protein